MHLQETWTGGRQIARELSWQDLACWLLNILQKCSRVAIIFQQFLTCVLVEHLWRFVASCSNQAFNSPCAGRRTAKQCVAPRWCKADTVCLHRNSMTTRSSTESTMSFRKTLKRWVLVHQPPSFKGVNPYRNSSSCWACCDNCFQHCKIIFSNSCHFSNEHMAFCCLLKPSMINHEIKVRMPVMSWKVVLAYCALVYPRRNSSLGLRP